MSVLDSIKNKIFLAIEEMEWKRLGTTFIRKANGKRGKAILVSDLVEYLRKKEKETTKVTVLVNCLNCGTTTKAMDYFLSSQQNKFRLLREELEEATK